ncbi:Mrp family chromosome partitioning ATPase [Aminivibrio pyruvatiphilus]|jgi:Mrp family chromosome partitioning ATPase|uniref:Iron-sulfur cluster carrier protein n=1 Tax=Aminivibrio pyruvatiphilus TaxID=1005740 RepID=A0A4R8M2V2_9BACT|nr:Mrp/NBP35 family ATP-binding protein [Aminivibrio pyruvatiphilus]TDY59513.1 Mrp family chromosome partitioning ATPase [Aminivibrio pyruvatiphilus]
MTLPPKSDKKQIKKIYAVGSGKGGVGKSSVTSLLAVAAARQGKKVGIMDADITGPSIPTFFGLRTFPFGNAEGIEPPKTKLGIRVISMNLLLDDPAKPVVWRGPLLGNAVTQFFTEVKWEDLDVLFIDLPPGTGDAVLTVMQTIPLDGFLLVTSPQEIASLVVRKAAKMAEMLSVPLAGVVENMSAFVCPDCGKRVELFGKSHSPALLEHLGASFWGSLPLDPALAEMADSGTIENYGNEEVFSVLTKGLQEKM